MTHYVFPLSLFDLQIRKVYEYNQAKEDPQELAKYDAIKVSQNNNNSTEIEVKSSSVSEYFMLGSGCTFCPC